MSMTVIEQRAYESITQIPTAMRKQNELISELIKAVLELREEVKNLKEEKKNEVLGD